MSATARVVQAFLRGKEAFIPPSGILSVADYYRTPGAKDLAHRVKNGDPDAIKQMAAEMAVKVPGNAVLIPIPSSTGQATATKALAEEISRIMGAPVADVLSGRTRPKLYDLKEHGKILRPEEFGYKLKADLPPGVPVLVDNVLATGTTANAAEMAIPGAKVLVHSVGAKKEAAEKTQMRESQKVVLSYLQSVTGASTIPETRKSKVDMTTQTAAVEKLLKDAVNRMLPEYKGRVYAVGGYVRDKMLGTHPKDIDLVVDSPDDDMKAAEIFSKKLADAIGVTSPNNPSLLKDKYGIWGVALLRPKEDERPFTYDGVDVSGYVLEVTPPRIEGPYNEKREPEYVKYTTLEEDAKRRDLTVNAIYQDVSSGEIKDFVGGMEDLKSKTLRPPPHPGGIEQIYREDPLRIFRIIRFKGKLPGFKLDETTENTLKRFAKSDEGRSFITSKVSKERIKEELHKILTHPDGNVAADGMDMMRDMGVLDFVAPALTKLIDVRHDDRYGHHGESVWDHTLEVMRRTPSSETARLAALFHDIGKPLAVKEEKGKVMFPGHAEYGVDLVNKALKELTFDNKTIKAVSNIVHSHMALTRKWSDDKEKVRVTRAFIQAVYDNLDDALAVIEADIANSPENTELFRRMKQEVLDLKKDDVEKGLLAPSSGSYRYLPPLSGDDIKAEFKEITDGPVLGEILNRLKKMLMEGDIKGDVKSEARRVLSKWSEQKGWEKQIAQALETQKASDQKKREEEKGKPARAKAFEKII